MKKRVLVVENNKDILDLIDIVLTGAGFEVEVYLNELHIVEQVLTFKPHLILLDIIKPTLEGTELCRQLKEAEGTKHIPVVVLSTHPQVKIVKDICADEVIDKPFDIDVLVDTLQLQLKKAG